MSIFIDKVSKLYSSQKALDEVSFQIKEGEVVGFLGPNGAGKSTLMKIITTYIPSTQGKVKVCDIDVEENPIEVKKQIGYLPEHNPLYLEMYVKEYLSFVAEIHQLKNIKTKVDEMIELVGLSPEKNKKIGALSKGYRQRVGLAQAIIHNPKVLILDEPTSGLDPNQIVDIRNLIKELGKQKTILMSTHIMQEVEAICDRIIIINKGKIVADDKTDNIKSSLPSNGIYAVEFSGGIFKDDLLTINGVLEVHEKKENHWIIVSSDKTDIRNDLFQLAVKNKSSVLGLHKEEKTLEDIFKELTSYKSKS